MTRLTVSSTMPAGDATITTSICEVCGAAPCVNRGFCRTCQQADARRRDERTSPRILKLRRLLDDGISLNRAWHELQPAGTPQTVIEAILHSIRKRGEAALDEPGNRERLARCDAAALAQIDDWIVRLTK